jgi:hypothetical protein
VESRGKLFFLTGLWKFKPHAYLDINTSQDVDFNLNDKKYYTCVWILIKVTCKVGIM